MSAQLLLSLASAVRSIACTCRREFKYHGVGVAMCRRCILLVEFEELDGGTSETRRTFDFKKV